MECDSGHINYFFYTYKVEGQLLGSIVLHFKNSLLSIENSLIELRYFMKFSCQYSNTIFPSTGTSKLNSVRRF